jgi:voltage-gated potassium channel
MRRSFAFFFDSPFLRRVRWHLKRVSGKIDRKFFVVLFFVLAVFLGIAAVVVWLTETDRAFHRLWGSLYWAGATVLGLGSGDQVTRPIGFVASWVLGVFGVAIVALITGALVGFVIDFLLKEGQGMGAAGYRDHIVVCGWNSTARDLITELSTDEYPTRIVLLHDSERNPAGDDVYFVRGDTTNEEDLKRAGIDTAVSAIICPADGSGEADMRSILTVLAIENMAPQVRTIVEVNDPSHVAHFERADVDEVMVTSKLAAHLLARTALYPGLSELVVDIVSGGEGSELYRVALPEGCQGKTIDEVSAFLRANHHSTLLAVSRGATTYTNPDVGFRIEPDDDLIVLAETLGNLVPLHET